MNNAQELSGILTSINELSAKALVLSRVILAEAKTSDDATTIVQANMYIRVLSALLSGMSKLHRHKVSPISVPSYVKTPRDKILWVEARRIAHNKNKESEADIEKIWKGLTRA